jgi:hypothetical protein
MFVSGMSPTNLPSLLILPSNNSLAVSSRSDSGPFCAISFSPHYRKNANFFQAFAFGIDRERDIDFFFCSGCGGGRSSTRSNWLAAGSFQIAELCHADRGHLKSNRQRVFCLALAHVRSSGKCSILAQ